MDPYYKQLYENSHTAQNEAPSTSRFAPSFTRPSTNPIHDNQDPRSLESQRELRVRKVPIISQKPSLLSSIGASIMCIVANGSNFLSNISPFQLNPFDYEGNSQNPVEYYFDDPIKTEEWKANEWETWKEKIEAEWQTFNDVIERERLKWLTAKERDWSEYTKYVEYKWTHYSPDLEKLIKSDILKRNQTLDEREWDEWMRSEGKELIRKDVEEWIAYNESYLNVWSIKEWVSWRNQIITKWISSEWKREEDEYWARWEENWVKHYNCEERNSWIAWRARINKEMVEWNEWTKKKEEQVIDHRSSSWGRWKTEKQALFDMWLDSFVDEWIKEKHWFIWTSERNDYFARNRYIKFQ
ncbi:tryptophan-rich antigen [Plasmodium yoelii]|uniref:Tryptophan-rich protein n=3 Tax=Plasmodium yoelii TaxID=5861 RepID=A0AAE9WLA3_PLAYO|nr:tryptophan-rich antigen [Plasmodium yoelii]EAA15374.1 secreted blood-stage antigen pAg-3 [Plasmodium yoelii yoelii]AAF68969.1 secreted blood-stage antigen pAg-3 [Plasmodium yoelii]WBY55795.1 tryptophan-rich protein [Plasmodium yoelii yoelii]CDU16843.1 tryptophan/threonine-rich antigen, putative [Plasmodium yoelii]VTZ74512.1 tryptophan-rich antigen [Plasmodium yoelii]|eukprot:XP_723809.1 tryptophan-rich antigen [Plasmodium yoelii]